MTSNKTKSIDFDIAVIGGGPAGMTAGIYGCRAGMNTVIFEKAGFGGQLATTDVIENFPGVDWEINGYDLSEKMKAQALHFGCKTIQVDVKAVSLSTPQGPWKIETASGSHTAHAVIAATGAVPRRLGIPGEDQFWGRGVSVCATCDGMFFRGKRVVVIGGGDTAVKESAFLARLASHLHIVHRRDRFRADLATEQRLDAVSGNVEKIMQSRVTEIVGDDKVTAVVIEDLQSGQQRQQVCDGVFVFVGTLPASGYLPEEVKRDQVGYVLTDQNNAASLPGLFACGDVRKKMLRQVITACGEGAQAAYAAQHYVETLKGTAYE